MYLELESSEWHSTIIILMTINGHAVCEILGKPHKGPVFLIGAYIAGLGVLGPFVWSDAAFWLGRSNFNIRIHLNTCRLFKLLFINQ